MGSFSTLPGAAAKHDYCQRGQATVSPKLRSVCAARAQAHSWTGEGMPWLTGEPLVNWLTADGACLSNYAGRRTCQHASGS